MNDTAQRLTSEHALSPILLAALERQGVYLLGATGGYVFEFSGATYEDGSDWIKLTPSNVGVNVGVGVPNIVGVAEIDVALDAILWVVEPLVQPTGGTP